MPRRPWPFEPPGEVRSRADPGTYTRCGSEQPSKRRPRPTLWPNPTSQIAPSPAMAYHRVRRSGRCQTELGAPAVISERRDRVCGGVGKDFKEGGPRVFRVLWIKEKTLACSR